LQSRARPRTQSLQGPKLITRLKVAAFTGGKRVPSARFRVRALIRDLAAQAVDLQEYIPPVSKYPPRSLLGRAFWLPAALCVRVPAVALSHTHDVTLLQRELISNLATFEGLTKTPRAFDVDDAIFLRRDGAVAKKIARRCDLVICGNAFLADWFSQWHRNVELLPTAIDCERFTPTSRQNEGEGIVIGWTGSYTNLRYLRPIEPALANVLKARPNAKLRIICDRAPDLPALPQAQIEYRPWVAENEVPDCQQFDIGIMPLDDGDWERGKCAFKLLQYMACGKPVVASPVGVNAQILTGERVGLSATSVAQWEQALVALIDTPDNHDLYGTAGRALVEQDYATPLIAKRLSDYLRGISAGGS